ncbi:hypothetical protein AXG93_2886s1200 [Marchantia polymorpha subsp. ruderalis]|uniref:Uncharacterized protein n=1 Tax=Marchantia polymorpha subsp. ruderalis TaxID=1480154 RepID=A0A176WMT7_MARPO|nr:hypothetical protein AXG93_2886s1200 [Marchantia polymorpha subsp. ruderalis]
MVRAGKVLGPKLISLKDHAQAKEMECDVLRLEIVKEKEFCEEEELSYEGLRLEIAKMKIVIMDLRERSEARKEAHNVKLQYVNELTTSLAE